MKNKYIYGIFYVAIAAFMWSLVSIALKSIELRVPMATVNWFRFSSSFVLLVIWLAITNKNKLKAISKPSLYSIIAALGLAVNYWGYVLGVKYASAGTTQVIIQIGPLLFALSGFIMFKEIISLRHIIGLIITTLGMSLFFYYNSSENITRSEEFMKGVGWIIAAAVAWAIYAIFQKKAMITQSAHEVNLILYLLPAIAYTPFVDYSIFHNLTSFEWLILIFLGVNTIIAYGFLAEGLAIIEANKASMIISFNPVLTFFIMYLIHLYPVNGFQGETLNTLTLIGAIIALSGVILVVGAKRRFRN